jgi:hypothetical protein
MSSACVAKYLVTKSDTLVLESTGVGTQIVEYYRQFVADQTPPSRYLPSNLQKIPVNPGQTVEVEYGERAVLPLALKIVQVVYYTDAGKHRGAYRSLTCAPMTINVDGVKYEGEMIAYDDAYPGIALGIGSLRPLNEEAKTIGGLQLEVPAPISKISSSPTPESRKKK